MTTKAIKRRLEKALIGDDEMQYELYEYELEELLDDLRTSMIQDEDEFIFAVTENTGDVAMVLIEASGKEYVNESAREKLRRLWGDAYISNMHIMIPLFARQLNAGEIPVNGVKTVAT